MKTLINKRILSVAISMALMIPLLPGSTMAFAQAPKNLAPVIHGIKSPTVLNIDTEGTWTVNASDPENGSLSYMVDWGDNAPGPAIKARLNGFVQTSTFTHRYSAAGNYKVKFTVEDEGGRTSASSVTVHVIKGAQTQMIISDLTIDKIKAKNAKVNWTTNVKGNSQVWYSTVSPVNTSGKPNVSRPGKQTKHEVPLNKLQPDTTYYVVVKSNDKKNGTAISPEISFKTLPAPVPHNQAPVITSVDGPKTLVADTEGTWTLNAYDPKNGPLTYSVDWGDVAMAKTLLSLKKTQESFVQTSTFTHTYAEDGTYTIIFTAKNDVGQKTTSTITVDVTPGTTADEIAPTLSNLAVGNIGSTTATVTWNTDEDSDSRIWEGTTTPVDTSGSPALSDATLTSNHSIVINGLVASTTYFIVTGSSDASGNIGHSTETSFTTSP